MKNYDALARHFSAITTLKQVSGLMNWDRSVMMPPAGVEQRARQMSVLNVTIHALQSDPRVADGLAAVNENDLDDWQRANLRLMREHHTLAVAVPPELVAARIAQATRTEMVWRQARADNQFSLVAPELEKLFAIVRDCAGAMAEKLGLAPYDALMRPYLPHMSSGEVDAIFDDLAGFLPAALDRAIARQQDAQPLDGPFPVEAQQKAADFVARQLGFDLDSWGRLDVSAHPFSSGIGGDVRITARYAPEDFISGLQAVAHEAGHGFYDHHVPPQWGDQPVGVSGNMGMGIHKSQSLGLEMQMGRSRGYWEFLAPHLAKIFGRAGTSWSGENLYRHATRVGRGLVRIEADEVSYPLHVILRYRLEKDLLSQKLAIRDLPEAWNAAMQDLLGVTPPTDSLGCMQDIHWHYGMVGYFPAYAIGAVIAAQFTQRLRQDIPDLEDRLARGDFFAYTAWMRDHVQSKACLVTPPQLIESVSGSPLSASALKAHLTQRYLS